WILLFSVLYVTGAWALWYMTPDSSNLMLFLVVFYIAFIAAESALNFVNAYLPSLGTEEEVGKISGSGSAFGYAGGLVSLIFILVLLAEDAETGKTLIGIDPIFGLDPSAREGTRSVGPLMAIWFVIFMIPFFRWVHDDPDDQGAAPAMSKVWSDLKATLIKVWHRPSTRNFLIGGMFYRDALNALYAFGGVYATLVLGWETLWLGVFGIISVISAAIFTWVGGRFDAKVGPKPVIVFCICMLLVVSAIIVGMSRTQVFGVPVPEGALTPDIIFFICGCIIGAAGGALYAASRSLMVRHTDPERPTEAFGLFALSGKATAFLAPMLIGIFTAITGNVQLGFLPVIVLFLLGLVMLRWVNKDGDRAVWSAPSLSQPS
ncbi:MAG: MFS transporter, partial [Pseudomonadota bacterium]